MEWISLSAYLRVNSPYSSRGGRCFTTRFPHKWTEKQRLLGRFPVGAVGSLKNLALIDLLRSLKEAERGTEPTSCATLITCWCAECPSQPGWESVVNSPFKLCCPLLADSSLGGQSEGCWTWMWPFAHLCTEHEMLVTHCHHPWDLYAPFCSMSNPGIISLSLGCGLLGYYRYPWKH